MSDRYYPNDYIDRTIDPKAVVGHCSALIEQILGHQNEPMGSSIYAGLGGIALLYEKILINAERLQSIGFNAALLAKVDESMRAMMAGFGTVSVETPRNRPSPLNGELSRVFITLIDAARRGDYETFRQIVENLIRYLERREFDKSSDFEILNGRAGFLFFLLFINSSNIFDEFRHRNQSNPPIPLKFIHNLADSMIDGTEEGDDGILRWWWHDSMYLGAAHGVSGILYTLLKVPNLSRKAKVGKSLEYVLDRFMFQSGNIRSSEGSRDDRLIHWCHGAPGYVHLVALAASVFGERRFVEAVTQMSDVIFERGLLKKGHGLCHGVAGNAYAFDHLNETKRRDVFIHHILTHPNRKADAPFSLFEGTAGTAWFLLDVLGVQKLRGFPMFEL